MRIDLENLEFANAEVTPETARDPSELVDFIHLIGGDITIVVGECRTTYPDTSVGELALVLAQAILDFLLSPKERLQFFAPECEDFYDIRLTARGSADCAVYLNERLICDGILLLDVLEGMRAFIGEVRTLYETHYAGLSLVAYMEKPLS